MASGGPAPTKKMLEDSWPSEALAHHELTPQKREDGDEG